MSLKGHPQRVLAAAVLAVVGISAAVAQEVDNGTDPTKLSTSALIQYKHTDLRIGRSTGLFEAGYTQPLGEAKRMALSVNLPVASGVADSSFGFGDASLKFTHVVDLNRSRGIAYTAEFVFDTADRDELGAGHTWLKASGFYAMFLPGGILAPALVQAISVGDRGNRARINNTTLDVYWVPKLDTPSFYVTYDPSITYDWERDAAFGSLIVTLGRPLGKFLGGDSQVFLKPQILVGGDRPAEWSVQVGFKVIGF